MLTQVLTTDFTDKATKLRFKDVTGIDTGDGTKYDGVAGIDTSTLDKAVIRITDPDAVETDEDVSTEFVAAAGPVTADWAYSAVSGTFADGYYTILYDLYITGSVGSCDITDYSSTVPGTIKFTSAGAHGLTTGMYIEVTASVSVPGYIGFYGPVTVIDTTNFYVTGTFTSGTSADVTIEAIYRQTFTEYCWANVEMALDKMYAIYCEMEEGTLADAYMKDIEMGRGLFNAIKAAYAVSNTARVNNIYGRLTRMLDFHSLDLTYT